MIIIVQGENFRPHKVEALVDDMLSLFLQGIKHIDSREFASVKEKVLLNQITFSNSLKDVADKYYSSMQEKIFNPNERDYTELMKLVTPHSLYAFAKKFMMQESRRLTIELFAKQISAEEKNFLLMPSFNLNQKGYEITSLEVLTEKKFNN